MKIYERLEPRILFEYMITKYVEMVGSVRSTKVIALNNVNVGIQKAYYNNKRNMPVGIRPVIWMEHIEGKTFQYYIDKAIFNAPRSLKSYNDKYDWAMQTPYILDLVVQYVDIIKNLEDMGLSCDDHHENFDNFIVQKDTNYLYAIDYSLEVDSISSSVMDLIQSKVSLPDIQISEPYLSQLKKDGIIH